MKLFLTKWWHGYVRMDYKVFVADTAEQVTEMVREIYEKDEKENIERVCKHIREEYPRYHKYPRECHGAVYVSAEDEAQKYRAQGLTEFEQQIRECIIASVELPLLQSGHIIELDHIFLE